MSERTHCERCGRALPLASDGFHAYYQECDCRRRARWTQDQKRPDALPTVDLFPASVAEQEEMEL